MTIYQTETLETDDIPATLREREQWICWRTQDRDGKATKVPIVPGTGGYASATDRETWRSFEEAVAYADGGDAAGIGFVFTDEDPFVGVDLDDCRDPETGAPSDTAREIIVELESFTEVSPSGTGYHVIVRGSIPGDRSRRGSVEMYETARFFTVTGDHVDATPARVRERSDALEAVYTEYIGETETSRDADRADMQPNAPSESATGDGGPLEDAELLERARNATNGEKFDRLWRGSTAGYESQSEADMALCCLLAFWTGGDPARVDRLFRKSGLVRDKWDEVHYADGSTYGEKTVERAITNTSEFYDPDARGGSSEASSRQNESSIAGSRDEPTQNQAYLVEKNRLLTDRVADLEAKLKEKDERIDELETTNEALREQLSDCQKALERRGQTSSSEMDESGADDGDSIWGRARRFVGDTN